MAVFPVVMSGGSGTRLWPASAPTRPKQFVPLLDERSSFQQTVERVWDLRGDGGELVVVAGAAHEAQAAAQLAELGRSCELLLEPEPRDSAPAVAAAAAWIAERDPEGVAVIVSADHHIPEAARFRAAVRAALPEARNERIVLLGVRPRFPATAYGYVEPGRSAQLVKPVARFVEKPDAQAAADYVSSGYLWNSGNFIASARVLLQQLELYAPEVAENVRAAVRGRRGSIHGHRLSAEFRQAPKISFDYAVMEKTTRAAVLPVDFEWRDIGSWDAVWTASRHDVNGNAASRGSVLVECENCLVRAPASKRIAVIGLRNFAVVEEGGDLLVCDLERAQEVKAVAQRPSSASGQDRRFCSLEEAANWFELWLRTSSLPLWWAIGADHLRGGFHEAMSPSGMPAEAPRRARVQARQCYVYATAAAEGWPGPWQEAAGHGVEYLLRNYRRSDGLYRTLVAPDGGVLDETPMLYDQAFALLAFATLHRIGRSRMDTEAVMLRNSLEVFRHPPAGFRENGSHPFQANAHMHLLEACLAWAEIGGDAGWDRLSDEVVALALARFIDPQGAVREFFNPAWEPADGPQGLLMEPGHQFEWAWLLDRYARRKRDQAAQRAAERAFLAGLRGVDPGRAVVVNQVSLGGAVLDGSARLWPQTERLKAALRLRGRDEPGQALAAAGSIAGYLSTPVHGAWWDLMQPNGTFDQEPAPASSFYHIVSACVELAHFAIEARTRPEQPRGDLVSAA